MAGCLSRLGHQRHVAARGPVDLPHRQAGLADAQFLLLAGVRDLTHQRGELLPGRSRGWPETRPACATCSAPSPMARTEAATSDSISRAASPVRCARDGGTSSATTAKPLPCSPARAASTEAFKARIVGLECNAVDDARDIRNPGGLALDAFHGARHVAHGSLSPADQPFQSARQFRRLPRIAGVLPHRPRQLPRSRRQSAPGSWPGSRCGRPDRRCRARCRARPPPRPQWIPGCAPAKVSC